jgi:hypothetical protein
MVRDKYKVQAGPPYPTSPDLGLLPDVMEAVFHEVFGDSGSLPDLQITWG